MSADDNSIYRALNRFEQFDLIRGNHDVEPRSGPSLLPADGQGPGPPAPFAERNILVFNTDEVRGRLEGLFAATPAVEEAEMDDPVERKMQPHRLLASFFLGISVTLLMTSTPATLPDSVSPGWMGLWLVDRWHALARHHALAGVTWRAMPIVVRRGPGLAYMTGADDSLLA